MTREMHYVTFASLGTFIPESTTLPIDAWDTKLAVEMAERVVERYNAKPYGFRFTTQLEAADVPDGRGGTMRVAPKKIRDSGFHHLGGKLTTIEEVEARNNPAEAILLSNMRGNQIPLVVVNTNSYRATLPFEVDDVIIGPNGDVVERGDDPKWVAYRKAKAR